MVVVVFHCLAPVRIDGELIYNQTLWSIQDVSTLAFRLASALFSGAAAVSIFFVLSGFVLFLALRRAANLSLKTILYFCARRFGRIYPALAVNLILMAACLGILNEVPGFFPSWARLPINLQTLEQNMLLVAPSINGASWTLRIEFDAIPIILMAYFASTKFGLPALILIALAACAFVVVPQGPVTTDIYAFAFMFLAGMVGASLTQMPTQPASLLGLKGVFLALLVIIFARLTLGYDSRWAVLSEGLASAYLVTALASGRIKAVDDFLGITILRFCGRISYSLYLYHALALPIIAFGFIYRFVPGSDPVRIPLLAIATLLATIALGWISYRYIEVPGMKIVTRIVGLWSL